MFAETRFACSGDRFAYLLSVETGWLWAKADICRVSLNARFRPKADFGKGWPRSTAETLRIKALAG